MWERSGVKWFYETQYSIRLYNLDSILKEPAGRSVDDFAARQRMELLRNAERDGDNPAPCFREQKLKVFEEEKFN